MFNSITPTPFVSQTFTDSQLILLVFIWNVYRSTRLAKVL